jgi:hypothetical protein
VRSPLTPPVLLSACSLTKKDLFVEKLKRTPLSACFAEYKGSGAGAGTDADVAAALSFISRQFEERLDGDEDDPASSVVPPKAAPLPGTGTGAGHDGGSSATANARGSAAGGGAAPANARLFIHVIDPFSGADVRAALIKLKGVVAKAALSDGGLM